MVAKTNVRQSARWIKADSLNEHPMRKSEGQHNILLQGRRRLATAPREKILLFPPQPYEAEPDEPQADQRHRSRFRHGAGYESALKPVGVNEEPGDLVCIVDPCDLGDLDSVVCADVRIVHK